MVTTHRWARHIVLLLVVCAVAVGAIISVVHAAPTSLLGNLGPDPGQFKNTTSAITGNFYYYLGDNTDVKLSRVVTIPVYQKAAVAGNMTIRVSERGNSGDATITYYHTNETASANRLAKNASGDITVPASAFGTFAEDPSYKVAMLVATVPAAASATDYVTAAFKIDIRSPSGSLVGYSRASSRTDDYFAIANRNRCNDTTCGQFYEYTIPFGKPCNEADGRSKIYIYDGDNVTGIDTSIQYNRQFKVRVYDDGDRSGGTPVLVTRTNSDADSVDKLEGNSMQAEFEYNFIKGHKYRLVLSDVYQNNVLQFKLPFDSMNYTVDCNTVGSGTLRKDLALNPSVVYDGSSVTAMYTAWVDGASSATQAQATALLWQETDPTTDAYSDAERLDAYRTAWPSDPYSGSDPLITVPQSGAYTKTFTRTIDATRGSRVCAQWRVKSSSPIINDGSAPNFMKKCVNVGYRPRAEVWGNDIRVGSGRSVTENAASLAVSRVAPGDGGGYTGTWSEYGIFAPFNPSVPSASVQYVASAAGLVNASSADQRDWSKLTFANNFSSLNPATNGCADGGCFAPPAEMGLIPNVDGYLTTHGITGANIQRYAGNHTISANIPDDPANPTIIIANNISIEKDVTEVNAWLIARGSIDTCSNVSGALTVNDCTKPLRVNGPIMAKTLYLKRVADIKANRMAVGETLNLRGDAYIWAYKTTHSNATYRTTGIKELPPRY